MNIFRIAKLKRIFIRTIPISFIGILLLIGLIPTWYPTASGWVEVTKIGLSWPVLAVILIATVIWLFEYDIKGIFSKVTGLEAGGLKIQMQGTKIPFPDSRLEDIDAIKKLELESTIWRFRFAEIFLHPFTKTVLTGLNKFPTSEEAYYNSMTNTSAENKKAILDALYLVEFIKNQNGFLFVTDLGKTFISLYKLEENS